MSKGFSREDDLIKKLKNCLGTLPDQQDISKEIKHPQPLKYRFEHEILSQQIKQPYKANGRHFLDDKQQFVESHKKEQNKKRNRNQLQICIEDKYKKRNSYYEQKTPLADISNKQFSFNNIRKHEQTQINYSRNREISKNRNAYNIAYDHAYQQRGQQQRKYSTARAPNNENTRQTYRKNCENQAHKLQPSNQKQYYQTYKARPCYEKFQKQLRKQPLRLNEQNIGSIRRKRRQSGKIADQLYKENESQFSQSKSSLQSSKKQFRFEQAKTVENQLKDFFCKNCQNNDNVKNEKIQRNKKKEIDFNQKEQESTEMAEKLKKISQLNDRINEKITNIIATFQNSTQTLYSKLYSKQ